MTYIEGGWPGSNPKDSEFFHEMRSVKLEHAALAAFGATRRPGVKARQDARAEDAAGCPAPLL